MMYSDEIISEVWRNRDACVEMHRHDLGKIISDLKKRQKKPHFKIVDRRTPKQPFDTDTDSAVAPFSPAV